MPHNTLTSYGSVARIFHWLTALLILSALALGLYAESLPQDTDVAVERLKGVFSLHKTIGISAFFIGLCRILWVIVEPKPVPLHPSRRMETWAAEVMHWALYGAMVIMPLSGWIGHAAQDGFAPILWPFGQTLFFVPQSPAVAVTAEGIHKLSAWVLYGTIGLHVLGALKHVIIDRDGTMARMTRGIAAGTAVAGAHASLIAPLVALVVWAGVIGWGVLMPKGGVTTEAQLEAPKGGNWQVEQGSIGISVRQMGSTVTGSLPNWTAEISYDAASGKGSVDVIIDTGALQLGTVSAQAKDKDFFDTATFPTAEFKADITRLEGESHQAVGTLTLRGQTVPLTMPFTLTITDGIATMAGTVTLDRRAFGMGPTYPDESTVGFAVPVDIKVTASQK